MVATAERIPRVTCDTVTLCLVVPHLAFRIIAASTATWIFTPIRHARLVMRTVFIDGALWSAVWRTPLVVCSTGTSGLFVDNTTLTVGSAWGRVTRISDNWVGLPGFRMTAREWIPNVSWWALKVKKFYDCFIICILLK